MQFVLVLLATLTPYVASNEKIEGEAEVGYYIFLCVFAVLYIVFGIIM